MVRSEASLRQRLLTGLVIPACPLPLNPDGSWSPRHQRGLVRYYDSAGAGGLAVGVHSTQFAIREPGIGLLRPVLELVARELDARRSDMVRIAGICGSTPQAMEEAAMARELGYEAGLVSLTALRDESEASWVAHCREISGVLPVIGFYLQPAVGGQVLPLSFWRSLVEIPGLVAIKIAPFNRYQTLDVVRAVIESGRDDVALYTGNDDQIVGDLLTPFTGWVGGRRVTRFMDGGLLGQWGVWTRTAVELLAAIQAKRAGAQEAAANWWQRNAEWTDANGAIFDAAHQFAGCIPGIMEVLRRIGLAPSARCLDPGEVLSPGQAREIDRIVQAYPNLPDDDFVRQHRSDWLAET